MIPDGQSVTDTTLARWYKGGEPLAVDEMACGLVRTYSSDAPIADSAPSGTAYATGFKSHTGFVGVLPDVNTMPSMKPLAETDKRKPVASILEAAQLLGYTRVQTFFKIVLPQVVKIVLPSVTNEVITLVKDTSLVYSVSYIEMFAVAKQIAAAQTTVVPFFIAGIFYYVFNYVVAWVMELFEKKLNYYR